MENLQNILPLFDTKIISFEDRNGGYTAVLRLNIETKTDALEWLKKFSEVSLFIFRVDRTFPENTQKLIFKKEYRCIHNSKPSSHRIKTPRAIHTSCNAKLTITVKRKNMKRSKDKYLRQYPTEILIRHTHNHSLVSVGILKKEPSTKKKKIESVEQASEELNNEESVINNNEMAVIKNESQILYNEIADIYAEIDQFSENLKKRVTEKPEIFFNATKAFLTNCESLKADSSLISALQTFGKLCGCATPSTSEKENVNSGKCFEVKHTMIIQDHQQTEKLKMNVTDEHSYQAKWKLPIPREYKKPYSLNYFHKDIPTSSVKT